MSSDRMISRAVFTSKTTGSVPFERRLQRVERRVVGRTDGRSLRRALRDELLVLRVEEALANERDHSQQ